MQPMPVRVGFADQHDDRRLVVEWILSSVCNYDCSYCPVYLHDGRVRWPRYDDIIRFSCVVRDHYVDAELTFLLSGGEITLYPHLGRLARDLRALPSSVAILSNGSRPLGWWREHGELFDEVLLSFHHERADPDHLVAVARQLATASRVQLNVVVDPAAFDVTMAMAARVEAETTAIVHRKIMFLDSWRRRAEYTPDQHARLTAALRHEAGRTARQRPTVLKGDLDVEFSDGGHRMMSPLQIIDEGLNCWQDWECAAGQQTLFVRFDEIWRAACREGGRIGSIFDTRPLLPDADVRCTAGACNCIAGIKARKAKPLLLQPGAR